MAKCSVSLVRGYRGIETYAIARANFNVNVNVNAYSDILDVETLDNSRFAAVNAV